MQISNIKGVISASEGSSSNDLFTLTFNLNLEKWGTEDVTMALALDKIVARS